MVEINSRSSFRWLYTRKSNLEDLSVEFFPYSFREEENFIWSITFLLKLKSARGIAMRNNRNKRIREDSECLGLIALVNTLEIVAISVLLFTTTRSGENRSDVCYLSEARDERVDESESNLLTQIFAWPGGQPSWRTCRVFNEIVASVEREMEIPKRDDGINLESWFHCQGVGEEKTRFTRVLGFIGGRKSFGNIFFDARINLDFVREWMGLKKGFGKWRMMEDLGTKNERGIGIIFIRSFISNKIFIRVKW